jgi:hypothetical protein
LFTDSSLSQKLKGKPRKKKVKDNQRIQKHKHEPLDQHNKLPWYEKQASKLLVILAVVNCNSGCLKN